jgi:adenylate cyclase
MALEIERRFLVRGDAWRSLVSWSQPLRQGYLVATAEGFTVRVRQSELEAWLTLKAAASADGLVRHEYEYPIPLRDAADLLALCPSQVAKMRHGLALSGGVWVLDEFQGANAPLVVAEVELEAVDRMITPPEWCALEITGRHELSNSALARRPLASWSVAEQRAVLDF